MGQVVAGKRECVGDGGEGEQHSVLFCAGQAMTRPKHSPPTVPRAHPDASLEAATPTHSNTTVQRTPTTPVCSMAAVTAFRAWCSSTRAASKPRPPGRPPTATTKGFTWLEDVGRASAELDACIGEADQSRRFKDQRAQGWRVRREPREGKGRPCQNHEEGLSWL
jgi:hypothetical protein